MVAFRPEKSNAPIQNNTNAHRTAFADTDNLNPSQNNNNNNAA